MNIIALDIETTGIDKDNEQIIEIAAIKIENGQITDTFDELINPRIPIPEMAAQITGITDSDVKNAPLLEDVKEKLITFIGDLPIMGHFIHFDIDFLKAKGIDLPNIQYDTFVLTDMLIPGLPSYSLETITQLFKIEHHRKHRAMDDTLASMHLFNLLYRKIRKIKPEILTEIQKYLKRTSWPMKIFFENPEIETNAEKTEIPLTFPSTDNTALSTRANQKELETAIYSSLTNNSNLICEAQITADDETAPALKWSQEQNKPIIIARPFKFFQKITAPKDSTTGSIATLRPPHSYISQKRLQIFQEKEFFTDNEITFLIKILLWLPETVTGDIDELRISGEDHLNWQEVCLEDSAPEMEKDGFFQKAYVKAQNANIILVSHQLLAQSAFNNHALIPSCNHLIITSAHNLAYNAVQTQTTRFDFEKIDRAIQKIINLSQKLEIEEILSAARSLHSKTTLLLGLTGIFFDKKARHQDYEKRVIISDTHLTNPDWQKIQQSAENIITQGEELCESLARNSAKSAQLADYTRTLSTKISDLKSIFTKAPDEESIVWIHNFDEYLGYTKAPLNIGKALHEKIFQKNTSTILLSPAFAVNGSFTYIRNELQLGDDFESKIIHCPLAPENRVKMEIPENLPLPMNKEYPDACFDLIRKVAQKEKGHLFIALSSKKAIESIFHLLAPGLKAEGIHLLAQNVSGSKGKILEKFKLDPENSILVGTIAFWKDLDLNKIGIRHLILQKVPFDPMGDPVFQKESERFFDSFMDYSLPRAVIRFKEIVNKFLYHPAPPENAPERALTILDTRLIHKKYGEIFLSSIAGEVER